VDRRIAQGYCDRKAATLDEALKQLDAARAERRPLSVGLIGNCADILPEMVRREIVPDLVTDQTSAHDALLGYVPKGLSLADAADLRKGAPGKYIQWSMESMAIHCRAMIDLQFKGSIVFDYGNNLRGQAK